MRRLPYLRKNVVTGCLTLAVLAGAAAALSACNTFAGMGQDLQAAGKAIDNTAEGKKSQSQ